MTSINTNTEPDSMPNLPFDEVFPEQMTQPLDLDQPSPKDKKRKSPSSSDDSGNVRIKIKSVELKEPFIKYYGVVTFKDWMLINYVKRNFHKYSETFDLFYIRQTKVDGGEYKIEDVKVSTSEYKDPPDYRKSMDDFLLEVQYVQCEGHDNIGSYHTILVNKMKRSEFLNYYPALQNTESMTITSTIFSVPPYADKKIFKLSTLQIDDVFINVVEYLD